MKITIGGASGTGTSTISKMLASELGYKRYSAGTMQRMNADELGMTIEDYDQYLKSHPELDTAVEDRQKQIGQTEDNFILESRLAWYAVPDSFKIKLDCDLDTRIARIAGDTSEDRIAHKTEDFEKTKKKTLAREATYNERFSSLYGIEDWNADQNFDVVIDTTDLSLKEIIEIIVDKVRNRESRS